jgi:hypothetical protein
VTAAHATSTLSRQLHDLLHREAHLKLWRARIAPRWSEKEAELRAVQAARPTLFALLPRRRREDYQTRLAAAQEAAHQLRERVAALERCEPFVAQWIEREIESLLREDCPEYAHALAAQRHKEEWLRGLESFATKIHEFTRALGNVRNLACSGYARHTQAYSAGARQAFALASAAARQVEDEGKSANQIADRQLEELKANGVNTRRLPRLPDTAFSDWVTKINAMPLAEAQPQFDSLIETTRRLHESGVPELRAQADHVQREQEGDIRAFLRTAWERFRREIAAEIFPGDTERSVRETEQMLASAAQDQAPGAA